MIRSSEVFVGIDVSKSRNTIALSDAERGGEVRFWGEVKPISMQWAGLSSVLTRHERLHFYYEAGPAGYVSAVPPPHGLS